MHAQPEVKELQLQIRHATRADIPFLAWCNYTASSPAPGFCYWDPLLEDTHTATLTFIEAVLQADALAWGRCEEFMIVEQSGKPIAGASGFVMDAEDYRPFRLTQLPAVAALLGWDQPTLDLVLGRYAGVWSDPREATLAPSASWTLECVAVVPEARGQGVGKTLIRALLAEGKRQGHTHAGIAVTLGNTPAEKVYEAVGFQMVVTYGAEYFEGYQPGLIKYRMRLD